LRLGRGRHGDGRHVHAGSRWHGDSPHARAVGLQGRPEEELGWRPLRLEDDERQARRPSREDGMNFSAWNRQIHRWLSVLFTVPVTETFIAMVKGPPPMWITSSPLFPLALLFLTGAYMFVLPYIRRRKTGN